MYEHVTISETRKWVQRCKKCNKDIATDEIMVRHISQERHGGSMWLYHVGCISDHVNNMTSGYHWDKWNETDIPQTVEYVTIDSMI